MANCRAKKWRDIYVEECNLPWPRPYLMQVSKANTPKIRQLVNVEAAKCHNCVLRYTVECTAVELLSVMGFKIAVETVVSGSGVVKGYYDFTTEELFIEIAAENSDDVLFCTIVKTGVQMLNDNQTYCVIETADVANGMKVLLVMKGTSSLLTGIATEQ